VRTYASFTYQAGSSTRHWRFKDWKFAITPCGKRTPQRAAS